MVEPFLELARGLLASPVLMTVALWLAMMAGAFLLAGLIHRG